MKLVKQVFEGPEAIRGIFIHWLVYDIPKEVTGFDQASLPREAKQVTNDFGKEDYGGPSPSWGTHRYIFTIYALDVEHMEGVSKKNFFKLMNEHTVDKAKLIGLYKSRQVRRCPPKSHIFLLIH